MGQDSKPIVVAVESAVPDIPSLLAYCNDRFSIAIDNVIRGKPYEYNLLVLLLIVV